MSQTLPKEKPDLRKKLGEVPHRPGVYVMRDRLGRIVYVGKARDLRKRLANYFLPSGQARADLKTRALLDTVWDYEWHVVRSEPEALLLEGRLIKDYRPRYNIMMRDDKRFLLVKVNLNDPFPRFQLTRQRKEDGARYFGPFAHSGPLRSTIELIRKRFRVRACRPLVPGENDYKHCLNHIIKNCSAPCVGKIDPVGYRALVEQACDFLDGSSHEMVDTLEGEMRAAAEKQDFERAAQLRDMVDDLKRTTAPMRRFTRRRPLPGVIDPADDLIALADALDLPGPPEVMECFDISNISNTHIVASMVRFRNGLPENAGYRRYRIKTVGGQNDFASMAEVVRRRYSRILLETRALAPEDAEFSQETPLEAARRLERELGKNAIASARATDPAEVEDIDPAVDMMPVIRPTPMTYVRLPDLVIVDGGKGQLSAASKELTRLGLGELPIIGLAKEFEEIYRPARPLPLRLPEDSGALRLLQRIRDEAHRFANSFHQLLLKKRVAESILDDCPGVSQNRKKILLTAFGSIARLRKASIEDIAAVEGIGPKLAGDVHRFLESRT
jgi:excinuclease ABC subunit C